MKPTGVPGKGMPLKTGQDMRTVEDILKEMKPLMGTDNPAERERLDALTAELRTFLPESCVKLV